MKKRRIAFDLHGVLDTHKSVRDFFVELCEDKRIDLVVLSGSPQEDIIKEVYKCVGRDFSDITYLSLVDFFKSLRIPMELLPSKRTGRLGWNCDERLWWTGKSILCSVYKLDVLIDDKKEYAKYFGIEHPTNFVFLDPEDLGTSLNIFKRAIFNF